MKIVKPQVIIESNIDGKELLLQIERAGRTSYKSEANITEGSAEKFISSIIKRGHESVIEHGSITVRFICDRGVSHEIVRHRLASYTQESTRYVNYSKDKYGSEVAFVKPYFFGQNWEVDDAWKEAMKKAEESYMLMLGLGMTPEAARSVLPNSVKTEIVMTANPREWRHFLKLRGSKAAHPDIRFLARDLCKQFQARFPVLFDDITWED